MEGGVMLRRLIVIRFLLLAIAIVLLPERSSALDVVHDGTARPGEFVGAFRAGPGFSYPPYLGHGWTGT